MPVRFPERRFDFNFTDNAKHYVCDLCGELCTPVMIDDGLGYDDAYGVPMNHHDYKMVSDCCESGYKEIKEDD